MLGSNIAQHTTIAFDALQSGRNRFEFSKYRQLKIGNTPN